MDTLGDVSLTEGVRDRLGTELFRKVAGPDGPKRREFVHGSPGPRWFEPDSPIARVHGDASMFVGGIRAIMLQSLHPAAMQGVADHSGYQGDMWGRLAQVANYIAITTFGTEQHAMQAIRGVQRAHASVTGTMPDGTPYDASDPWLLGWVHAAEVDSFLASHDRYGARPLVGPERDEYVAQTAVAAGHLGVLDAADDRGGPARAPWRRTRRRSAPPRRRTTRSASSCCTPTSPCPRVRATCRSSPRPSGCCRRDARRELRLPPLPGVDRALGALGTRAIRWAMASGHEHARELQRTSTR